MKYHSALSLALLTACLLLTPAAQAEEFDDKDPGSTADLPWLPRIPGATLQCRVLADYDEIRIPVKPVPMNHADDPGVAVEVHGAVSVHEYSPLPQKVSVLHALASYRKALEKAGFEIVFECKSREACGSDFNDFTRASAYHADDCTGISDNDAGLTARRKLPNGQQWVFVAVGGYAEKRLLQVVAQDGEASSLIPDISPQSLAASLAQTGSAVVPGIYFDSDKAVVKPESKPALEAMAQLLKQQPKLGVYVVGHTDDSGSLDHNLTLSQQRAEAVKTALVKQYGIAATRLDARGMGPLAPVAVNSTEEGRSENRRVVIVARGAKVTAGK